MSINLPKLNPVKEYFRLQGQFPYLTNSMIEEIEKRVYQEYEQLKEKAKNLREAESPESKSSCGSVLASTLQKGKRRGL